MQPVFPKTPLQITAQTAYRNQRGEHLQKELDAGQLVEMGDQLWFEYDRGLIIPVTVNELDDIVVPTAAVCAKYGLDPKASLWVSIEDGSSTGRPAGVYALGGHETKKTEGGWPVWVTVDPLDLADSQWVGQSFWIDEVVGHAIQITGDNVARDFQTVRRNAGTVDKRQAHRRHKKLQAFRKRRSSWINKNHIACGGTANCPIVTTPKPVYMKVGRP